jgi:peptidoglycan-associated lipoprotein
MSIRFKPLKPTRSQSVKLRPRSVRQTAAPRHCGFMRARTDVGRGGTSELPVRRPVLPWLCPFFLCLAALVVAGCATKPEQPPPPSAAELNAMTPSSPPTAVTTTTPLETQPRSPLDDPSSPLYRKVIYFDYDTAEIQPRYIDLLRVHAGYLYQTPGASVTLEGHTDERGTRDYNLALGDQRADSVKRFLTAEGVPADKLTTLSYGEERPADPGHNEQSWALNRRVELVY